MLNQLLTILLLLGFMAAVTPAGASDKFSLKTVESTISRQEAAFSDIVAGAEKHLKWANGAQQKTDYSLVYLHGFSASRQELSPLIETLADRLNANAYFTRLAGHGRSDDAMLDGSVERWKQDTLEAYQIGKLLGDKVIVIGTSTGGTLLTWLSNHNDAIDMHAAIMISPNYGVQSNTAWLVQSGLGLWFAKLVGGDYRSFTPQNDFHARYWTERYPLDAVVPMLDLVDEVEALDKSEIRIPHLMVYSPDDKVVDVSDIKRTIAELESADVTDVPFTESKDPVQHVLVGNASSPNEVEPMLDIILEFINRLAESG